MDQETRTYLDEARSKALTGFPLSRVTEEFYDNQLGCLPPVHMSGVPGFFVSEAYTENIHAQFIAYRGNFYGGYVDVTDPASRISHQAIEAFHAVHADDEPLTWYPNSGS